MKLKIDASTQGLFRTIVDQQGSYTIPFIQSENSLEIEADAEVRLLLGNREFREKNGRFAALPPGEYTLHAGNRKLFPLGIGTIVAALGDSITEGYHGHAFQRENLDLAAADFPAEAVSHDHRNFPQFSPTAHIHKPTANCMQSWMTDLNNLLTGHFGQPFFIANEGWGGYTSGRYLQMVREEANWRNRITDLKPTVWLLHLGVNDERHEVPVATFQQNMAALLETLISDYGANTDNIYLARPCYDYDANFAFMEGYLEKIEILLSDYGINRGPDFYGTYSADKGKWYGDDPVHPNITGMELMARLWYQAITAKNKKGKK